MSRLVIPLYAAAFALGAGSIAAALGRFVFPLDDAYIYFQYARSAAGGSWFRYFSEEPISTGATSLLWGVLTAICAAAARWLPLPGPEGGFLLLVYLLQTGVAAVTFALAMRLAHRLGVPAALCWVPVAVCLLTPYWTFGVFNGMETGLWGLALVAAAWAVAGGSRWWLILLPLGRPEGALLSLLALFILSRRRRLPPVPTLSVAGTSVFVLVLPLLLTGESPAAWEAKALWTAPHPVDRAFYSSRLPYFLWRCLWFGLSGARAQPPLDIAGDVLSPAAWPVWTSVAFLGGGAALALARGRGRFTAVLWGAASLLAMNAIAWDAQHYRYLVAGFPLLAIAAAAGWLAAPRRRVLLPAGSLLAAAVLIVAFVAEPSSWDRFRVLYRGETERLRLGQMSVGSWVDASLPEDARILTHDVGAIAFYGHRPVVDMVGLVTPELTGAYRHGEGAIWEALSRVPRGRRPTHAAWIPRWTPELRRTLLVGERVYPRTPGPEAGGFEVRELVWPPDDPGRWPGGDFGDEPAVLRPGGRYAGWTVVDRLDVGDLTSEREHGFRFEQREITTREPLTFVRDLGFVAGLGLSPRAHAMEGGRVLEGTLSFTMRASGEPGRVLLLRATAPAPVRLTLKVGEWVGQAVVPGTDNLISEIPVEIPPDAVASDHTRVHVSGGVYRPLHWWWIAPAAPEP